MPGLVGIVTSQPNPKLHDEVRLMTSALLHEAHYSSGTFVREDLGLCLGWACHRDSYADCMPIWSEKRDKCLFFYGEHFPVDVGGSGRAAVSQGCAPSASSLMRLYEEQGEQFFLALNGSFHGVLVDAERQRVLLFNDRFGMRRLYVHKDERALLFAAEAKCLLRVRQELRELDWCGMGQLLSIGCALGGRTLFAGIELLPGGALWTFEKGKLLHKAQYFDRRAWEEQSGLTHAQFYDALRNTVASIIPKYLSPVEHIGVSLTGGLDTRIVMAYSPTGTKVPCYTFGSMYRNGFDVRVARKVAAALKLHHCTIRFDKTFLSQFPKLAERSVYISDGNIDAGSGAAELYGNRLARSIAPIRLTGSHGSEVLRSVTGFKYRDGFGTDLFDGEVLRHMEKARDVFDDQRATVNPTSYAAFVEAPFYNANRVSVEESQVVRRSPFMDNELLALLYRAPRESLTKDAVSLRLVRDGNQELARITTNRGVGGAGAGTGILSTLKQRYHETMKLAEFAYDMSMPHAFSAIDSWLKPLNLEKLFLGWNGFYHLRKWYRDELSEYLMEVLLDPQSASRPYYRKGVLERMVHRHVDGNRNYTREINAALTLELTQRTLIEGL